MLRDIHQKEKNITNWGGASVSSDTVLAHLWATARTLLIADGPNEVHLVTIESLTSWNCKELGFEGFELRSEFVRAGSFLFFP